LQCFLLLGLILVAICNVSCSWSSFWMWFAIILAPEAHFGCYLWCFMLLRRILDAICNVFCSLGSFWLLFAMFFAPEANFGCYLQCFLLLGAIFIGICNVFCLWNQLRVLFAMYSASGTNFGCYLQCFLHVEQISVLTCMLCYQQQVWVLFASLSASGTNSKCYLQCWTRLENILRVTFNVFVSWGFLWVPFPFLPPLGPQFGKLCCITWQVRRLPCGVTTTKPSLFKSWSLPFLFQGPLCGLRGPKQRFGGPSGPFGPGTRKEGTKIWKG
jgi:hypothetical protein